MLISLFTERSLLQYLFPLTYAEFIQSWFKLISFIKYSYSPSTYRVITFFILPLNINLSFVGTSKSSRLYYSWVFYLKQSLLNSRWQMFHHFVKSGYFFLRKQLRARIQLTVLSYSIIPFKNHPINHIQSLQSTYPLLFLVV